MTDPAADLTTPLTPTGVAEVVTCPECGTGATVTLNRRLASDFCARCDYPLFWTPSVVLRENSLAAEEAALRRLPGTVGRSTTASLSCPHCAEPNPVSGVTCVRCGQPLHLVQAPPPPPPPVVQAPPPPPVVEPEPAKSQWWAWVLLGLICAAVITLVVLAATGHLG